MTGASRQPRSRKLQGEGNRTADRRYREAASAHAATPKSKRAARAAERAIESAERTELAEAERIGKARAREDDQRHEGAEDEELEEPF